LSGSFAAPCTKELRIILGMTADVLNGGQGYKGREIIPLMCEKF
jgi:hypothetical protein